jgi:serine phosphatase RsbU (regulator of sigma subunit)
MRLTAAIAKIAKYAAGPAGDSAEVVERPLGGLSVMVVDGQGSGRAAKTLSAALAGKATAMINDGARDGAVIRAVHDWLFAQKNGKVSASICILSVDTQAETLVVGRSGNCPALVLMPESQIIFADNCHPLGFYRYSRPMVDQLPLMSGTAAISFSDGITGAGKSFGLQKTMEDWQQAILAMYQSSIDPAWLAETILETAIKLDGGRPRDDMTVAVVAVQDEASDGIRRLRIEYPLR